MLPAGIGADYKEQEQYFASQEYKNRAKAGLSSKKRKLPHPKVLSYPVAVSPDENNGSRLLIKCFEYIPPQTSIKHNFATMRANKNFEDEVGNKYKKGDVIKNKDGSTKFYPKDISLSNLGASDQLAIAGTSHLYYIELPIPQDVNDSNTVTWGDNSLNIFQLAGLTAAQELLKADGSTFEEAAAMFTDPLLEETFGKNSNFRSQLAAVVAGKAFGADGSAIRPNTVLGRATGEILNSNLELLFDSVNLRSFPFAITFSPRSKKESMRVKHIIRALKSSMAAKKKGSDPGPGQGGIFLKAPDVFQLRYLHNGKEHPFLNSFKHCALTGMNVNYTNSGTFASYSDGTPVSIQVNLTFKELNPIYQQDYDGFNSNDDLGVGF